MRYVKDASDLRPGVHDGVRDNGLVDGDGGGGAVGGGEDDLVRRGRWAAYVSGGPDEWVTGGAGRRS